MQLFLFFVLCFADLSLFCKWFDTYLETCCQIRIYFNPFENIYKLCKYFNGIIEFIKALTMIFKLKIIQISFEHKSMFFQSNQIRIYCSGINWFQVRINELMQIFLMPNQIRIAIDTWGYHWITPTHPNIKLN
jgi:hypothetical protein